MKWLRLRTPQVLQMEVCAGQRTASRIQKDHQIEVVVDVGLGGVKTTVSHLVALNMANLEATGVVPILDREMRG